MGEHVLAESDELLDFFGADFARAELDGGLDRGKHEPLHAVAVALEVAHLGREERAVDGGGIVVTGEERAVAFVDLFENIFVVPEGVVGVETERESGGSHGRSRKGKDNLNEAGSTTKAQLFA